MPRVLDTGRRHSHIRRMLQVHAEAVQALLRLLEADGRIASGAEQIQAATLVASVASRRTPEEGPLLRLCRGWRSLNDASPISAAVWLRERALRQAAWAPQIACTNMILSLPFV